MFDSQLFNLFILLNRKVSGLTHHFVNTNEGKVSYLEGGKGPTLVLLHGFGANKDTWCDLAAKLIRHYHLVIPDIPGFGESYRPDSQLGIDAQTQRLKAFIDAKQLTNISLMGSSYGGYLACNLATKCTNAFSRLILISPLGVSKAKLSQVFTDICNNSEPVLLPRSTDEMKLLLKSCFYKQPFIPQFVVRQLAIQAETHYSEHKALFFATHLFNKTGVMFEQPLEENLKRLSIPVFVLWGEHDEVLSVDATRVIKQLDKSNVQIKVLNNLGHLPQNESPKVVAKQINEFLKNT